MIVVCRQNYSIANLVIDQIFMHTFIPRKIKIKSNPSIIGSNFILMLIIKMRWT